MQHDYTVHGAPCVKDERMDVTLANGQMVVGAKVPAFEAVLVPVDHAGGTCTFRYTGDDVARAQELYIPGTVVTVTVSKKESNNG